MQTQPSAPEPTRAVVVELDLQQADQVGGGKYITFMANGNRYFRDSWSGRIGVEDSATGTSHWL